MQATIPWLKFTLTGALVLVLLSCLWLVTVVHDVHERRAARAAFAAEGWELSLREHADVPWLRRLLGDESVTTIMVGLPPGQDLALARQYLPEATMVTGGECVWPVARADEARYLKADPQTRAALVGP